MQYQNLQGQENNRKMGVIARGVDGLIASAVSSRGSVDNVNAILSGLRNSGFAQSDVAYWAYTGTGTMEGKEPAKELRTIAALFQEHIHLGL